MIKAVLAVFLFVGIYVMFWAWVNKDNGDGGVG
jgi:hypothetical protein